MRRIPFWVLLLAACSGSPGELGQGEFHYQCVGVSDPYCDCDEHPSLCESGGSPTIEELLYERVPEAIAVGASFRLRFSYPGASPTVVSASPTMLVVDDDLDALMAGEVGVMGLSGDWVLDFYHLRLVQPTSVRVDRVDYPGTQSVTTLELEPGEAVWLRAMSVAGSEILYGSLPCSWTTGSATAIRLDREPGDNVSQITALATGSAAVQVTLGELSSEVLVSVGGAP